MPADAKDITQVPSLTTTHPNRQKWPEWIAPCVLALEDMIQGQIWHQTIYDWLELEDLLEYPKGKVLFLLL